MFSINPMKARERYSRNTPLKSVENYLVGGNVDKLWSANNDVFNVAGTD